MLSQSAQSLTVMGSSGVPCAYKVSFKAQVNNEDEILVAFSKPYKQFALIKPLQLEELQAYVHDQAYSDDLLLLFLPKDCDTTKWQKLASDLLEPGEIVQAVVGSGKLLYTSRKVVYTGDNEHLKEIFAGIAQFVACDAEVRGIEQAIEDNQTVVDDDIALTHQVDAVALKRWHHVNEMTEWVVRSRIKYTQLTKCLQLPTKPAQKAEYKTFSALLDATKLRERLEFLDQELEILEGIYELANDRLSEYSYFIREYRVELWITVLLLAEVLLLIVDICL